MKCPVRKILFQREAKVWGYALLYGLLPMGLTVIALREPSFPFFYLLFSLILLDVFYRGLEKIVVPLITGITSLAVYLAFRYLNGTLTIADLWHFTFISLVTFALITLVDRRFKERQELIAQLDETSKDGMKSQKLLELGLKIAAMNDVEVAFRFAMEDVQRHFGYDPVLLSISFENNIETEIWISDKDQIRHMVTYGDTLQVVEQQAIDLVTGRSDGVRTLVSAPLLVSGRVIGNLSVVKDSSIETSPKAHQQLERLATALATGMENARLRADAKTEIEARHLLAQEIHDGIAQTLSFLNLKARLAKELTKQGQNTEEEWEETHLTLGKLQRDIRSLISDLRFPKFLFSLEVPTMEGLRQYVFDFCRRHGLLVDIIIADDLDLLRLSLHTRIQLIRVLQEALTNVLKHAFARNIKVVLKMNGSDLMIKVEDDGRGFRPNYPSGENCFGLGIMKERVEITGGRLIVDSEPNCGTKIIAIFPVGGVR